MSCFSQSPEVLLSSAARGGGGGGGRGGAKCAQRMTLPLSNQLDDEDVAIIHESGFAEVFIIIFQLLLLF